MADRSVPLIQVKGLSKGFFEVELHLPDAIGLLSVVTGLFAYYGASIVSGRINTVAGIAEDVFRVKAKPDTDWHQFEKDIINYSAQMNEGRFSEVRTEINQRLIGYLRRRQDIYTGKLYPITLSVDQSTSPTETEVKIKSQDTPAFLYELTSALALLGININRMEVETVGTKVEDRLWLTTETGEKLVSEKKLKALRWAILMIKQFTHLLPKVPDPAQALETIVLFGKDVFEREDFDSMMLLMKKSENIENLSRVLGSSRFLWEEFIRFQHESIIQILGDQKLIGKRKKKEAMRDELKNVLAAQPSFDGRVKALNEYKDHEAFRIDLRHILGKTSYVEEFADEFTDLVEVIIEVAHGLAWEETLKHKPHPMASETEKSSDAIVGLGKLGGRELGFASDMELIFIYADHPDHGGEQSCLNLDFYIEVVRLFQSMIHARSRGVFEIDLRLRPYGKDGPLATSLDLFRSYYSPAGETRNFERQALVKLRPILGPQWLCDEIVRIRDQYVYSERPFDYGEALELRQRQRKELVPPGTLNAKYSAGGLIDAEYLVQTLQIEYGRKLPGEIRNPNTLKALAALLRCQAIDEQICDELKRAYLFLRDLINGLRIVRGNAEDLTIPPFDSADFTALARRIGYCGDDAEVSDNFRRELEFVMERAHHLYESEIQKMAELTERSRTLEIQPAKRGMPVCLDDLFCEVVSEQTYKHLRQLGFFDISDMIFRIKRICPDRAVFPLFRRIIDKSWPLWKSVADPDLAIRHLERFVELMPEPERLWQSLNEKEERIEILFRLFGSSRYLSDILILNQDYWDWVCDRTSFRLERIEENFANHPVDSLEPLRKIRHRETLRIALAEFLNDEPLARVFGAFSTLAEYTLNETYRMFIEEPAMCVIGLGKMGGRELNFSSDIDLVFLSADDVPPDYAGKAINRYVKQISKGGLDDMLFRVDLRLRPHGNAGSLFLPFADFLKYYEASADAWEYQAMLKARPVAGNLELGARALRGIEHLIYRQSWPAEAWERIRSIKRRYERETVFRGERDRNIKMGFGGIRDVEFTVQSLQLRLAHEHPELKTANTFEAIDRIRQAGVLNENDCGKLLEGYLFFRKIENRLQLFENRQVFTIPNDARALRRIARSMGFSDEGNQTAEILFQAALSKTMQDCRAIFENVFFDNH